MKIKGKKLYRSETNKVFSGVLGGLGEYFDIDPLLLRLGFVILVILTGLWPGVGIYILAVLLVPKTNMIHKNAKEVHQTDDK